MHVLIFEVKNKIQAQVSVKMDAKAILAIAIKFSVLFDLGFPGKIPGYFFRFTREGIKYLILTSFKNRKLAQMESTFAKHN